jgi:hypothetical protein
MNGYRTGGSALAARNALVVRVAPLAAALTIVVLVCASSALALRPWWRLQIDTAPMVLQPGQAADEVQELTVKATGGTFVLRASEPVQAEHTFPWNATHLEVQEGLEAMFGQGNIEVPNGQGDATGSNPYRIVWRGALADQVMLQLQADPSSLSGTTAVKVVTKGRSDATLVLTATNMGDADLTGPVTISAKLPPGLTPAPGIAGYTGVFNSQYLSCVEVTLSCTYNGTIVPYEQMQMILPVNIKPGASTDETVETLVSGGNAPSLSKNRTITVGDVFPSFGPESYELTPEEEGGGIVTQAGAHPFQLTTNIVLNQRSYTKSVRFLPRYETEPADMTKDLEFKLPPGLIGNPTPFPQCRISQFTNIFSLPDNCPNDTAVGVASVTIGINPFAGFELWTIQAPVFNLTPSVGEPARFGFIGLLVPVFLDTSVRTGGDYGVTVKVANINQQVAFISSRVTFWGVPGDPRHDGQRGWSCLEDGSRAGSFGVPCSATAQHAPPALLELPTSCTGALHSEVEGDSWQKEGSFVAAGLVSPMPALDGCNRLPFSPSLSVAPDGQAGSSPSGLTVGVHVPQDVSLDAEGLGEADVKDTTVTLPSGVALNPAAADGLLSCSEDQVALSADVEPSCPEASKVATVEIKSPLLPNALVGEVYLAAQTQNPFGSLVALYLVAEDPVSGTLVKLAGEVKPDPVTGQLVSTFKNTPQLPFEDLKLHFFGGDRAPLSTPSLCGSYTTGASIAPWSGNPPAQPSSTFQTTSGPDGSPCHDPLLFDPELTAGSTNIQAGAFTPFTTTMSREDGQQSLQGITLHMPPGVSGLLSGVKLCGEAEADAGTCGPESLIGETIVSVGLGGDPFSVKGGRVYITGSYEGAPFGLSIVNPAKAGPYDLGQVVVRAKLEVDPITAAITVTTDNSGPYRIPTILDGIPLEIKHVNVLINRPNFTFNPTNCQPMKITGTISSTEGASQALAVPFQVTNCATLGFKPGFKVSTTGRTSRAKGASLNVKLTYPKAPFGSQANIRSVKVDLPKQLPSRLTTLQKACTAAQFESNPAGCPADSTVGHATAITPLIPVPLTGPAYFVSYGGAKFPELVIVLQGYGVTLDLHGETFINKAGITSSTFHTVPDAPVGSFELTLPQGPFSALAANGNLCKSKLLMPTAFTAQNGATIKQNTPIGVTGCAKKKAKAPNKSKQHKRRSHGGRKK